MRIPRFLKLSLALFLMVASSGVADAPAHDLAGAPLNRSEPQATGPIIADHTVVDLYDDIPQEWIDQVKKMWVSIPGESHSSGYRIGCNLLETLDPRFQVNVRESGTPEGYTDQYLRLSRASWGDVSHATGWIYSYGEEDWYTSAQAISQTKTFLTYANTHGFDLAALGFGWCWDMTWHNDAGGGIDPVYQVRWAGSSVGGPDGDLRWGLDAEDYALTGNRVSMDTYLNATEEYIALCEANHYPTVVFFTTGPVDGGSNTGERGYQRHLKHEHIRAHVRANNRVLFDYADILSWGNDGTLYTVTWRDHGGQLQTFPYIHPDNMLDLDGTYTEDGDHIGQRGAVRLAKALWWMLARIAGWDGTPADALTLHGTPADRAIHLTWQVNTTLPPTSTWRVEYYTHTTSIYTATDPLSTTRSLVLTQNVQNYQWYTVTLHAMLGSTPFLSDTVRVMPTDRFVYLPLVIRED